MGKTAYKKLATLTRCEVTIYLYVLIQSAVFVGSGATGSGTSAPFMAAKKAAVHRRKSSLTWSYIFVSFCVQKYNNSGN